MKHSPNTGEKCKCKCHYKCKGPYGDLLWNLQYKDEFNCKHCQPPKSSKVDKAFQVWIKEHDNNVRREVIRKVEKFLNGYIWESEFPTKDWKKLKKTLRK